MKVVVSIPDSIFDEAERLAKRLNIPRSELYARALERFVADHAPDRGTGAMNAAVGATQSESRTDAFTKEGARRVLNSAEW